MTVTSRRATPAHCPYCALQCAMTITIPENGRPAVTPRDFPVNRGGLCQKGWTSAELLDTPDRLTTPLINGRAATWDEALGLVAGQITELQEARGRDAVAVFGSGALTNEPCRAVLGDPCRHRLRHLR